MEYVLAHAGALTPGDDDQWRTSIRYRPEDRRAVEALYRRVFGNDAAESSRLRWEWQYRPQPEQSRPRARDLDRARGHGDRRAVRDDAGPAVGAAASEVQGSWGMDVMVAPERQRQGLGEVLFRTWDRNVGASLGLGLSESSYRLFQKLQLARRRAGALPGQAADPARAPAAELAGADQPAGLRAHAADREARRADAAAAAPRSG